MLCMMGILWVLFTIALRRPPRRRVRCPVPPTSVDRKHIVFHPLFNNLIDLTLRQQSLIANFCALISNVLLVRAFWLREFNTHSTHFRAWRNINQNYSISALNFSLVIISQFHFALISNGGLIILYAERTYPSILCMPCTCRNKTYPKQFKSSNQLNE